MNAITPFLYGSKEVRTVVIDNQPWFVAKDVCDVLGLSNPTMSLQTLDEDERAKFNLGRQGNTNIVNEPGLYSLILGSRKPEAKKFKRWITHEVIPSIRNHGAYITPETLEKTLADPEYMMGVLAALKKEQDQRKALEQKVIEDRPKVVFAEAVEGSSNSILIGQLATILKQNGIEIGQNRLFNRLREEGFLCKSGDRKNLPTQRAMEMKLFEVQERTISGSTETKVRFTTRVTGRGQLYFLNKFKNQSA